MFIELLCVNAQTLTSGQSTMREGKRTVPALKETTMTTTTTRRRFIEIVPLAGVALFAACSPKTEPAAPAAPVTIDPPAAASPPPAMAPAPAPAAVTTTGLPMVDEKDAQAVALGYVDDTARADKVKFKSYVAGSECSNCALYQGKTGDSAGGCPLFQGKNVAAKGWCNSWVKKA